MRLKWMLSAQLPQAFGSQQAQRSSSEGPDEITVVKVQHSLADPDVQRVQVSSYSLSSYARKDCRTYAHTIGLLPTPVCKR